MRRIKRKGTLQLGMEAIVIIVIAVVLLGLAIGFIKGAFSNINDLTGKVIEQVKSQISDQLRSSDKKIAVSPKEIDIDLNTRTYLGVGVKNDEITSKKFIVKVEPVQIVPPGDKPVLKEDSLTPEKIQKYLKIIYLEGPAGEFTLGPQETNIVDINIQSKKIKSTIILKITVYAADIDDTTEYYENPAYKYGPEQPTYINIGQ